MIDSLLLEEGGTVQVTQQEMPKATYVKLRPENGNQYLRWSNQKAVLEYTLRNYATLCVNNPIQIKFDENVFNFDVVDLKPGPMVSILNTDVEVEFDDSLLDASDRQPSESSFGTALNQKNEPASTKTESTGFQIGNRSILSTPGEEKQEVAQNGNARAPRRKRGEAVQDESKTQPKSFPGVGTRVGATSGIVTPTYTTSSGTTGSTTAGKSPAGSATGGRTLGGQSAGGQTAGGQKASGGQTAGGQTANGGQTASGKPTGGSVGSDEKVENSQQCSNCLKYVPKPTIYMHEAFCMRNNYRCEICNLVLPKNDKEKHIQENHSAVSCPDCGIEIVAAEMVNHIENYCAERKIRCEYCTLYFKEKDLLEHMTFCGARTEQCVHCSRYIMFQDLNQHLISNCEFPPINKPPPARDYAPAPPNNLFDSQESYDPDQNVNLRASSELYYCHTCQIPFEDFNGLMQHYDDMVNLFVNAVKKSDTVNITEPFLHYAFFNPSSFPNNFAEAVCRTSTAILDLILGSIDLPAILGKPVLFEAARWAPVDNMELFIQFYRDDLRKTTETNENCLHIAANYNNYKVIPVLIRNGVDKEALSDAKETPLHAAIKQKHREAAKTLLFNDCKIPILGSNASKGFVKMLLDFYYTSCYLNETGDDMNVLVRNQIANLFQAMPVAQKIDRIQNRFKLYIEKRATERKFFAISTPTKHTLVTLTDNKSVKFTILNVGSIPVELKYHFPHTSAVNIEPIGKSKSRLDPVTISYQYFFN